MTDDEQKIWMDKARKRLDYLIESEPTHQYTKSIEALDKASNLSSKEHTLLLKSICLLPHDDEISMNVILKKQAIINDPLLKKMIIEYIAIFMAMSGESKHD